MKNRIKQILRENETNLFDIIRNKILEALILKVDKENDNLVVQSNKSDAKEASQETFRFKEMLKAKNFKWNNEIKAWVIPISSFEDAKQALTDINKSSDFVEKLENLEEFVRDSANFPGKANLMDKINMYVNDLANITDEKNLSAEIRRYLTFFSKFRGHSFYNTMLIWLQNPKATKVAGFKQWQTKFNRRVKKGASGIMIFAPVIKNFKDPDEVETATADPDYGGYGGDVSKIPTKKRITRFMPVYVFDIADTEAIDESGEIPVTPKWYEEMEPTERTKELYSYLKLAIENMGIKITTDTAKGGEKGFSAGNHINMSSSVEGAGELSTLVHEFAHELMHWKKSSIFYQEDIAGNRALMELQAESVAYVVMKHYDLPVQHQPTYIALWKGNKELILKNLKVISDVAEFIISSIDKVAKSGTEIQEDLYL